MEAIQRAKRIFIDSGLTNNISIAFEIYQEVLAERERALFISDQYRDYRPGGTLAKYERIPCPECDSNMHIALIEPDADGNKTSVACTKCRLTLLSEKSVEEWKVVLERRDYAG